MRLTGAEIIVALLEREGITTVAGIPGGSILPLYDALSKSAIRHVLVRHEQAAGFIAQGMARSTGKPAVCFATSGPGAMNLLTAIADARSDSVPIVAITGQVNTALIGTDAFQEADTFGLSFPITKHSMMVTSPAELLRAVPEAIAIAQSGRPGPVLIDVPRDVQVAVCEFDEWPSPCRQAVRGIRFHTPPDEFLRRMDALIAVLAAAHRPVLLCGGGCNSPVAAAMLGEFVQLYRLPVAVSLMGLGAVSTESNRFIGMVGMHGAAAANSAVYDADVVLALGVRFDDRATGVIGQFCPNARIIHVDIDAAEVNKLLPAHIAVVAAVESTLPVLVELLREKAALFTADEAAATARAAWFYAVTRSAAKTKTRCSPQVPSGRGPRALLAELPVRAEQAGTPRDALIVTTDVGQHQMWAAQYQPITTPRSFITSGSLGTMGFGLPAAIGAALAHPEKQVVCITGDGSLLMNIQELATLSELNLAVTIVLFENGTLGMVYQQQKYLYDKNYSASVFLNRPDFVAIARGFGIEALDADDGGAWYERAFSPERSPKPLLVRVQIDREEDVLPFVLPGSANKDAIQ